MKKFIALLVAGMLFSSMTVMAANSPSAKAIVATVEPTVESAATEGFSNATDQQAAAARGMSASEYYNNTVTSAPGVENAVPVGQGGKISINGVATNLTATLAKVSKAVASDANAQAAAIGGTLMNVVKVDFPGANYKVATINFYVKDLAAGTKIAVKQLVNGVWVDVQVVEVREDHVVLNLTNSGAVAFVALP